MSTGSSMQRDQDQRALRGRRRRLLLWLIAALYLFSVPWYRQDQQGLQLLFGLPDWVTVAVLCYVGAAILNAWAWRLTDVDDQDPLPKSLVTRPASRGESEAS